MPVHDFVTQSKDDHDLVRGYNPPSSFVEVVKDANNFAWCDLFSRWLLHEQQDGPTLCAISFLAWYYAEGSRAGEVQQELAAYLPDVTDSQMVSWLSRAQVYAIDDVMANADFPFLTGNEEEAPSDALDEQVHTIDDAIANAIFPFLTENQAEAAADKLDEQYYSSFYREVVEEADILRGSSQSPESRIDSALDLHQRSDRPYSDVEVELDSAIAAADRVLDSLSATPGAPALEVEFDSAIAAADRELDSLSATPGAPAGELQDETPPADLETDDDGGLAALAATWEQGRLEYSPRITNVEYGDATYDAEFNAPWSSFHGTAQGKIIAELTRTLRFSLKFSREVRGVPSRTPKVLRRQFGGEGSYEFDIEVIQFTVSRPAGLTDDYALENYTVVQKITPRKRQTHIGNEKFAVQFIGDLLEGGGIRIEATTGSANHQGGQGTIAFVPTDPSSAPTVTCTGDVRRL